MQSQKSYIGSFDDKGKPQVEVNGTTLPIIPYYTDPELDLAITILADYFDETAPIGTLLKCVFYSPDFQRDIVAALPKDQPWQIDSDTIEQWLKTVPPMP